MGSPGMGTSDFNSALWASYLSYLYSQGKIDVPQDFRTRISAIRYMLDSDVTGVINSLIDYSVNSASQVDYTIECKDDTVKALLNEWLKTVNLEIDGIPTGIEELAKEYYKERWKEGSLILARVAAWKALTINGTSIKVPMVIWLVNGSSVYVVRDRDNYKLGTDKFYLDEAHNKKLPETGEKIVIQRPFDRWWTEYATPYLIRKGVYRNFKALEMLQEKTEEVITKFVPYLFAITKGTERLFLEGNIEYDDKELQEMSDKMKEKLETYKKQRGKTPVWTKPFDTSAEHIIPDLKNVLAEDLFNQGYRAILAGLGFIDVIQGITSTRKEAVLNPAPFIEEVNAGVDGFKDLLMEIIHLIIKENKLEHRKLFDRNTKLYIANSPLKVNVQSMLADLRQGFIYGGLTVRTYQEILGIDPEKERERMKDEWENGDRELFYPHITQNMEDKGIDTQINPTVTKKPPVTQKEIEKNLEKDKIPPLEYKVKGSVDETENYYRIRQEDPSHFQKDSFRTITFSKQKGIKAIIGKKKGETTTTVQSLLFDKDHWAKKGAEDWAKKNYSEEANLTDNIEDAPYHKLDELPDSVHKLPIHLQRMWMNIWNSVYKKSGNESEAYRKAWGRVNKEKGHYKLENGEWIKMSPEEIITADVKRKQNIVLDRLIKEGEESSEEEGEDHESD